jgi:hypothetical protein
VQRATVVTLTSQHGSLSLAAEVDPGVPKGVAVIAHGLEGADPGSLVSCTDAVCDVRVEVG